MFCTRHQILRKLRSLTHSRNVSFEIIINSGIHKSTFLAITDNLCCLNFFQSRCDVGTEYLLTWDGGCQGRLLLNPMTRRGGYLVTVDSAEKSDKKQEEAANKMMELSIGSIQSSGGKGGAEGTTASPAPKAEKIPANTGAPVSGSVPKEAKVFTITQVQSYLKMFHS